MVVNLLKFKPDGGREEYMRYVQGALNLLPQEGRIVYSGKAGPDIIDGIDWDYVALTEYPGIDAFAAVMTDPKYLRESAPIRSSALEKTLCMISYPSALEDGF